MLGQSSTPDEVPDPAPSDATNLFVTLADELRRIAGRIAAHEAGHTLQPTALVNELYMKLFGGRAHSWTDEVHFMRFAAKTMRSILVDHKKAGRRKKRGGGVPDEPLDAVVDRLEAHCGGDLFGIHEALEQLAIDDAEMAEYVTLHFFGGRTHLEASRILGIGERTGQEHWQFAKAWLQRWLTR